MIASTIAALALAVSAQGAPAVDSASQKAPEAQAEPKKVCYTSTPSGSRRPRRTCVVQTPPAQDKPAEAPAEADAGQQDRNAQEQDQG